MHSTSTRTKHQRASHVMTCETSVGDPPDHNTPPSSEEATLVLENQQGMSVPWSEWQGNAEYILQEYSIPGMAGAGAESSRVRSSFPTTEKPPGAGQPDSQGEYDFSTLTSFQFFETGPAASVKGRAILRAEVDRDHGNNAKDDADRILATVKVTLTLADTHENRAALQAMTPRPTEASATAEYCGCGDLTNFRMTLPGQPPQELCGRCATRELAPLAGATLEDYDPDDEDNSSADSEE